MHSTNKPISMSNAITSSQDKILVNNKFNWWKILSFGANSRYLLTIAIIWLRAAQTNTEPMSQWSISSWILMTMPVWLPNVLMIFAFFT